MPYRKNIPQLQASSDAKAGFLYQSNHGSTINVKRTSYIVPYLLIGGSVIGLYL